MHRAGKVKFLAVAGPQRSAGYPDVPTVKEAGGPADLEVKSWVALLAPKGTPQAIIDKVNADLRQVLSEPDIRERFTTFGFEPYASPPSDVTKKSEKRTSPATARS